MPKPDAGMPRPHGMFRVRRPLELAAAGAISAASTLACAHDVSAAAGQADPGAQTQPRNSALEATGFALVPRALPLLDAAAPLRDLLPEDMGTATRQADGTEAQTPAPPSARRALAAPMPERGVSGPPAMAPGRIEPVVDTGVYPERAAGLVVASFGPVSSYCSGTLVGPATVLTAAHCLYDHGIGWADAIAFAPGMNGETAPFGLQDFAAAHVPTGFVTAYQGDYASVVHYDLAILTLAEPVGRTLGWFGFGAGSAFAPQPVSMLAYPGDRPLGTQWRATCDLYPLDDGMAPLAAHRCPVASGSSGGGMAGTGGDGPPEVRAITVATTPEHALAVTLGPARIAWIAGLWR